MRLTKFIVPIATGCALAIASYSPAAMGADQIQKFEGHYIHTDSQGNLIIVKPGSYKQILVGQGKLAEAIKKAMQTPVPASGEGNKPTVIYLNAHPEQNEQYRQIDASAGECIGGATVIHGRSFMYGVPRNVTPVINNAC